ncbi:MAG TPA: FAD-dependent oxidoreductase [Rhodothermales bacterium]|nr:FAD-dependent oxidoreductase [Rhodothermales bacterium]
MHKPGTSEDPLRVAIVGAGPAGFYAAEHLLRQDEITVEVDLFDRLPTPYGLVRGGVAPDHQKIKSVTRVYDRIAANPRFRFFGNVDFGAQVTLADLERYYHQVCFTTGAQTDRSLGIPGEHLSGSHSATEFVAWYNGHPDFREASFDLSQERAAIVGVGNVAIDVARILCRTPDELAQTDIADYALEALRQSRVREVYLLGRRGPAQAAFTSPELKELGEMEAADVVVDPSEVELDEASKAALEAGADRSVLKNLEILRDYARRPPLGKPKRIIFRFLVSPVEITGDASGKVRSMRLARNTLVALPDGRIRAQPTGEEENLDIGLVFRSIGYRGVALPGIPFDERGGTVPHEEGRVLDPESHASIPGLYVAGWIKRGPSGVIGTNKPDAQETVASMLEDARAGRLLPASEPDSDAVRRFIESRAPHFFTYDDWRRLDAYETTRGEPTGRPRVKCITIEEMIEARNHTPNSKATSKAAPRQAPHTSARAASIGISPSTTRPGQPYPPGLPSPERPQGLAD